VEEMSCLDLDQRGGADSHRARPAVPAALSPAVCATGRWPPAQRGWPAGRTTRRWLLLRSPPPWRRPGQVSGRAGRPQRGGQGEGGSGGPRQPRPARRPGWWRRVRPAQPGGHTAPVALHRRSAEVRLERGHDGTASGALADVANARWEDCVEEDVAGDVRAARRRRQRGSGKPEGP